MRIERLIRSNFILNKFLLKLICKLSNAELPPPCNIGKGVVFPHSLNGIVLHPSTIIEDNVTIFHQVTCGRGNLYNIDPRVIQNDFEKIVLKEGCVLCVGAKIICNKGTLTVGKNTVIAANAVLLQSTGDNEVWAGVPAQMIKKRTQ